jgi:monoamine oxidase
MGGRILTVRNRMSSLPVELGAEFVHGRPPEIWDLIRTQNLTVYEHTARALHLANGRLVKDTEVGQAADQMISSIAKSGQRRDRTFEDLLARSHHSAGQKNWARIHVEGFNAARSDLISVNALRQEADAAEGIQGDRTFRILDGYDAIPLSLLRAIPCHQSVIQFHSVVDKVRWRRGDVEVRFRSMLDHEAAVLRCRQLLITVPLGVLQAPSASPGAIEFDPVPAPALKAARSLKFGQVYRVTFRFREAFWEETEDFQQAGFLISQDQRFFTWWTMHPVMAPLLTGWMAGSAAEQFHAADAATVAREALASLARIMKRKIPQPGAFHFHDWRTDPFFRGAYSYVPASARAAREALGRPQADTLFFTGEAAAADGHASTVHGAIAAGRRSAMLILDRQRPPRPPGGKRRKRHGSS